MRLHLATLVLVLAGGCDDDSTETVGDAAAVDAGGIDARVVDAGQLDAGEQDLGEPDLGGPIGGDRPVTVYAPAGEPPESGWPLLLLLHGFRANPTLIDRNFAFSARVDADGIVLAIPVGTPNEEGFLRWAADFHVDAADPGPDVPYLLDVIEAAVERHGADPDRVYVMGHSNGGAMAQQLACHAADRVRGFVNVSGFNPPTGACQPSRALTAVFIHGAADDQVPYDGRDDRPGADVAAAGWAERGGCADPADLAPLDLEAAEGAETTIRRWSCPDGLQVERWRLAGTGHLLVPSSAFLDEVLRVLESD